MTSPTAQIDLTLVRPVGVTLMPRSSTATPSRSRPRPCTRGRRPAATKISSTSSWRSPSGVRTRTRRCSPARVTSVSSERFQTVTPSCAIRRSSTSATSGSSRARRWSEWLTMVTREPRRWKAWPSSHPMGPPPTTSSALGKVSRSKIVSLVRHPASARPGTAGTCGSDPVATTMWRAHSISPVASASTSWGERSRAELAMTRTPIAVKRSAESWGASRAWAARTYLITRLEILGRDRACAGDRVVRRRADQLRDLRHVQERLGRHAAGVQALSAHRAALQERDARADQGRAAGHREPGRPAPDDDHVVALHP